MPGPDHDCLVIRGLGVRYGHRDVLCGLDLPGIRRGRVTVLAGPNGAGKSTLLRAIAGTTKATGEVCLGDTNLLALPASARAAVIGYMPQASTMASRMPVLDSVIASLRLFGRITSAAASRARACATLERLGILDLSMAPLNQLSGGQRQLASLAQSLAREPKVLLLDEPTSALDLRHQIEVMTMLRSLATEGRIVTLVLHDLSLAARWADDFVLIRDGRIASTGPASEVLTPKILRQVFDVDSHVRPHAEGGLTVTVTGI